MPMPLVMGDPTSGPTLAGVPGAGTMISTCPTILIKNKPACTITDQSGPTGPVIPPLKPTVLLKGKPIALMGAPTATGATTTGTVGTVNC